MVIVAFVSQKGGVGKSTLARAVAVKASSLGLSVKMADLDPAQATSSEWHRNRVHQSITTDFSVELFSNVSKAIAAGHGYHLLVFDGPARAGINTTEITKKANLIVQPTGPSRDDLVPAVKVFHRVTDAGVDPKRLIFALCRVGTEGEEQAARAFISAAGYQVLQGYLPERPAFRMVQNTGRAVVETRLGALEGRTNAFIQGILDRVDTPHG